MSKEFRDQIYNELNLRETEDLLEILYINDHEEWSDTAFEVIKEILIGRLGEIPPQEELVDKSTEEESFEDDGFEEWEAKLLDDDHQPVNSLGGWRIWRRASRSGWCPGRT